MTLLEVLYRYGIPPSERALLALNKSRDVYGVRRVEVREDDRTICVEYDVSRLPGAAIDRLLLGSGIDVIEKVDLAPQPEGAAAAAPAQPSAA